MKKEFVETVTEVVSSLLNTQFTCPELRAACENWLAAKDGGDVKEATAALLAEMEEDLVPIERQIAFLQSERAAKRFGNELRIETLAAALKAQEAGDALCACPACRAAVKLLEIKERLLGE